MCSVILVLCVGVVSSARIYDYEGRLVQGNSNYGVDVFREGRQHFGPGPGPRDGPADLGDRPYGDRYGEADRHRRPPPGPLHPERRGFGDRSNEITDENIDRIRATIYSNIPADRQHVYADTYKHAQNSFNNGRSEGNEYRGGGRKTVPDTNSRSVVNVAQGRSDRTIGDMSTQGKQDASAQSSRNEAEVKTPRPEKPVASRKESDGRGVVEESPWIWSTAVETSTAAATTPDDLDNRASFTGDNCPTGKVRVVGTDKCVNSH